MSVYFFIASTNKVESNKMIAMRFKTFIIKVFVFINIYLLSVKDWRTTLTSNVPINNYTIYLLSIQEKLNKKSNELIYFSTHT